MTTETRNANVHLIAKKPLWTLLVLVGLGLAVTVWSLSGVVDRATRTAAVQDAALLAQSVATFRSLYTTEVVSRLEPEGIKPSHMETFGTGSIPLPITLSLQLAEEIGRKHIQSQVRIYSPYSFPWKEEAGLPDAFAREAWTQLSIAPDKPMMRFDQSDDGTVLRYAAADLMNQQCVDCHNTYPGSPKTDWQAGDMRGIVEVGIPLDSQIIVGSHDVMETIVVFSSLGGLWLAVAALSYWSARKANREALEQADRYRATSWELQEAIVERESAEKETRQLESQIQHAQKLESLSLLTGGLAHDFNNLLVPIIANADILKSEVPPESGSHEIIQEINLAAGRAADLCHQMLSYAGKAKTERSRVDLNQLLEETSQLMAVSISKRCKLELDLGKDLPKIDADRVQIGQVVLNLLTNASEALADVGGTIRVRTGRGETAGLGDRSVGTTVGAPRGARFSPEDPAEPSIGSVFFEVQDNGVGMDEATIQKIFDPFYSTKFTGRGLGLAAVQGIVGAHGGSIHVSSELGKFTCIRVIIPAADLESAVKPSAPFQLSESWTGSGTILLAEDETAVRDVVTRMLEIMGFDVVTANDGVIATALFSRTPERFAAVLFDLTMPRRGGVCSLREVRKIRPDLPAILFSGYSERIDQIGDVEGSIPLFIHKPFRSVTLRDKLRALLDDEPAAEIARPNTPPESRSLVGTRNAWWRARPELTSDAPTTTPPASSNSST